MFRLFFWAYSSVSRILGKSFDFDILRFEKAAWVSEAGVKPGALNKSIELVIVSTSKDFGILYHSVTHAINAISEYSSGGVRIIVPERDVEECQLLFSELPFAVTIVDESTLVSKAQFSVITNCFGTRDTWVLQQLLKVQAVVESKSDAVLILDSDTILLKNRAWFDDCNRQILMPTSEFNAPYYQFLNKLDVSPVIPEFSFISHHMIMQPEVLRGILKKIGLLDLNHLIEYCVENSDQSVQSPICIEYELYGQSLFSANPDLIFVAPWSNATIPRKYAPLILNSDILQCVLTKLFNSISFHSWS